MCCGADHRSGELSNIDRLMFAGIYSLAPKVLDALQIIKPETVIGWHRAGFRTYWRWKSRPRGGRPRTPDEIRQLIRDMSIANSLWGASRIHGELLMLGFQVRSVDGLEWDGPAVLLPLTAIGVGGGKRGGHAMPSKADTTIALTIGIDTGKNTLHVIGLDERGALVLREKVSRTRIAARFVNVPRCLVGLEAGMASHHIARELVSWSRLVTRSSRCRRPIRDRSGKVTRTISGMRRQLRKQ